MTVFEHRLHATLSQRVHHSIERTAEAVGICPYGLGAIKHERTARIRA